MKKILLSCLMLLLAGAAWAQGLHEVHLSVSGPAGGEVYNGKFVSLYNWGPDLYSMYEAGERVDAGPVYSVGYTYSLRSWFRVGAETSLGIIWADKGQPRAWSNGEVTHSWQRLYTVMPLVHFVALDKPHFKIYGKFALGGQMSVGSYESTELRFACACVPLGLQWGGERIFGLAEIGFGNVYIGRLGLGIRW